MSRQIQKEDVQIETCCCILKCMSVNWTNIVVTGISGIRIHVQEVAKVSVFTDNNLTRTTDNHFKIKLITRLLNVCHTTTYFTTEV